MDISSAAEEPMRQDAVLLGFLTSLAPILFECWVENAPKVSEDDPDEERLWSTLSLNALKIVAVSILIKYIHVSESHLY